MIDQALKFMAGKLKEYLLTSQPPQGINALPEVVLENVARIPETNQDGKSLIILTLINICEEPAFRNKPMEVRLAGPLKAREISANFDLFVLISFHIPIYEHALYLLDQTLTLFQSDINVDNESNAINNPDLPDASRFVARLQSLSLEDLNHLWGTLKIKQAPSLYYKVKIVQ
jgi:Pvc16 N-terminal domain